MKVYAIPGFLGLPGDWTNFELKFLELIHDSNFNFRVEIIKLDFFSPTCKSEYKISLKQWALKWIELVAEDGADRRWLVGYSLGGRLGLHALINCGQLFEGAVLLSTNVGLNPPRNQIQEDTDRKDRKAKDKQWANAFRCETWDEVLAQWNGQDVFSGSPQIPRAESNFCRQRLSAALEYWSLAEQRIQIKDLRNIMSSLLWVVGGNDLKFCDQMREVEQLNIPGDFIIIEDQGHRLLGSGDIIAKQVVQKMTQLHQFGKP